MPKTKKTRRGGVKHRARRLYKQLIVKPANKILNELLGIDENITGEVQSRKNHPHQHEENNPSKPWSHKFEPAADQLYHRSRQNASILEIPMRQDLRLRGRHENSSASIATLTLKRPHNNRASLDHPHFGIAANSNSKYPSNSSP